MSFLAELRGWDSVGTLRLHDLKYSRRLSRKVPWGSFRGVCTEPAACC